ncbi:MAG: hypothetical protein DIU78_011420 [Pseudomonadota bacterium]|nr:MAG: hypothetical protein DIU78_24170 [Pseudomonadota bacterium]
MRVPLWVLGLSAALVLGSCGKAAFDGTVYRGDDIEFRVGPVSPTWRAIEVEGALLAFRDDARAATVAVNGRCGLDGDDVPLQALTQHLFLHFTDREIISQQALELDGREALRTELVAELDGVPRRFVVYVLKKDGCVYDFMWIGGSPDGRGGVADFERFVRGFSTEV